MSKQTLGISPGGLSGGAGQALVAAVGISLQRVGSGQGQQHQHHGAPGTQGWPHPLPKISFPHPAAATSHQQHPQGKKPFLCVPRGFIQQDSLFSWPVPDTSPSLKVLSVLSALPKFPLFPSSQFQAQTGQSGQREDSSFAPPLHHHLQLCTSFLTSRC